MGKSVCLLPWSSQVGGSCLGESCDSCLSENCSLIVCLCGTQQVSQKEQESVGLLRDAGDLVTKDMRKVKSSMLSLLEIIGKVNSRASQIPVAGNSVCRVRYNLWPK